jgi:hypothetical protein
MNGAGDSETSSTTISQDDFPNVTSRLFEADVNIGRLTVEDVDTTNHLILDSNFYTNFGSPELKTSTLDKDYGLTMKLKTQTSFNMWMNSMGHWGNLDYKATLGHLDIPTTLNLTASTGKIEVKLDSQKLQDFDLNLGTGSAVVELGKGALPSTFKAHAGTGSIQIKLPKEVGLKIKHSLGTGSIKIDGQKLTGDGTDTFYSYDTAAQKIDLDLELGTGSLTIITQ